MKTAIGVTAIVFGVLFASSAQAALLGSINAPDLPANAALVSAKVYSMLQATPTTLETTVGISTTSVVKYGSQLIFTDTTGLRKQAVGSSTMTTLKAGANFAQIVGEGATVVVSSPAGSFTYDLKRGKASSFKPKVKSIASADLAQGGRVLAMIAKNSQGKSRLFLSQGNPSTVKEFPLPTGGSSCAEISLSPSGALAAVQCIFNGKTGIAIINLNGQTVGATTKKTLPTFSPTTSEWLSESLLVVGGLAVPTAAEQYRAYTVKSGKVTQTTTLTIDNTARIPAGATISAPAQLLRISKTKFYYSFLSLGPSQVDPNNSAVSAVIGMYDTATDAHTVLVNDGMFNLLLEAPTTQ